MDASSASPTARLASPSSPLSSLSRTPSPPPSPMSSSFDLVTRYPSPSTTCPSGGASPRKPPSNASNASGPPSTRDDSPPPPKRRRVSRPRPRPRMTRVVDLENPTPESEEELAVLLQALHKKKKIVVIAGAGISVSAGIPDFRSSTGLFTILRGQHGLRGSGKHLFDASVYKHDASTSSFHTMVRELAHMTQNAQPTPFHHMLASLAHEGRLMRLYSQNIDCIDTALKPLETNVPLNAKGPWPVTIQLHGGLQKMVCSKCGQLEDFDGSLFQGPEPPLCQQCVTLDAVRTSIAGKRSHGIGRLRPRIVLYNEYNPDEEAIGNVSKADLRRGPDAVLVVGTSLKIPGVRRLVKELCQVTRSRRDGLTAWINVDNEPQGAEFKDCWDTIVHGKCDDIALLANLPHWDQPEDAESTGNWLISGKDVSPDNKLEVVLESSPLKHIKREHVKDEAELPRKEPPASIPTPIPSPKPARKMLPGHRKPASTSQSKLPFQFTKEEPKGASKEKTKEKAKENPKEKSKKGQPRKSRQTKKEVKSRATDLTFAFRATKNVEAVPAEKARKQLPTGKPETTNLPELCGKGKVENTPILTLPPLRLRDSCTPPPQLSPSLIVSPKSKPNGMGLLID